MKRSVFSGALIAVVLAVGYVESSAGAEGTRLSEPPARAYKHFGIFRSEPEGVPAPWEERLEDDKLPMSLAEDGFNPDLAQLVFDIGPGPNHDVWVVPGRRYLHLMFFHPKTATGKPVRIGQAIRRGYPLKRFGLVPEGVTAVEVADGLVVPTRQNFYSVDASPEDLWRHPRLIRGASSDSRPCAGQCNGASSAG